MTKNLIVSDLELTDEQICELHARYLKGDNEAGGLLIQSQSRVIMKILNRICHHKSVDVEDVFSEIMPEILKSLRTFDPSTFKVKLGTYIHVVARRNGMRAAISLARRGGEEQFDPEKLIEGEDITVAAQDAIYQLRSIIQHAPPEAISEECRFIADRMFKGESQDEISRQLGWTPMRVSFALKKIKGLLAKKVREHNIDISHWINDERLERMSRWADEEESIF